MRNPRKGDRVEITQGKHAGMTGVIKEVDGDRTMVEIPGLPYERWFPKAELEYRGHIEAHLSAGEARRKRQQALIKEGKICPSYPHSCTGNCLNISND